MEAVLGRVCAMIRFFSWTDKEEMRSLLRSGYVGTVKTVT